MTETTRWSIHVDAPIERVWTAITQQDAAQPFYFGSVLDGPVVEGGAFRYRTPNGRATYIDGVFVEVRAPTRLVQTFRFTDLGEAHGTVTWTFEPERGGTRVTIAHDGLGPKHLKRVQSGWNTILGRLRTWLESGRMPLGVRVQNRIMNAMFAMLPGAHRNTPGA